MCQMKKSRKLEPLFLYSTLCSKFKILWYPGNVPYSEFTTTANGVMVMFTHFVNQQTLLFYACVAYIFWESRACSTVTVGARDVEIK